jgi:hypothetical protein
MFCQGGFQEGSDRVGGSAGSAGRLVAVFAKLVGARGGQVARGGASFT